MSRRSGRLLACAGLCLVTGAYACDTGHGFVKDDFVWILTSREWSGLFGAATGFFRPVVSVSFAIDHALFGRQPLGYGLTNLAILLACVGTIAWLFQALKLPVGVAGGAALVWALNFHGINMAVLWTSGRTALLLTVWAAAAAWAWTRGSRVMSACFTTLAMWSKEEAFVLPAVLTVWALIDARADRARDGGRVLRDTWLIWVAWIVSLALRARSGAFTPSTAPAIYRYQFDLGTFSSNALEYADRVGTTPLLVMLVFWLAAGRPRVSMGAGARGLALKGGVWMLFAFAPTILLPGRSSLYVVMPSVGAVLMLAALAADVVPGLAPAALKRAAIVLLLTFAALLPVYHARNQRYVREADLSSAIAGALVQIAGSRSDGGLVVIQDPRAGLPTAEQALGTLADRAALLMTDGKIQAWIDPPPAELLSTAAPDLSQAIATIAVESGRVRRIR